jgi:putative nucleotidyltransferase with HDIG domain
MQVARQRTALDFLSTLKVQIFATVHLHVGSIVPAVRGDDPADAEYAELYDRLTERMASRALELPLLPDVAAQVIALSSSGESDARALADVIRRDGPMSAHILRLANSPLFRPRSPIVSLPHALSRLGMTQIRQIAFAVSCKQRVFRARGFEPEVTESFRHSFAVALAAQELARARRWNVEEAFLAGLLHDVGRPVLLQAIVDMRGPDRPMLDRAVVSAVVAALHAGVGGLLAQKWALPSRVAEAITMHHDPLEAKSSCNLAMLVGFADDIPAPDDDDAESASKLAKHPLVPHLNLYPDEIDAILARRRDVAETLQAVA